MFVVDKGLVELQNSHKVVHELEMRVVVPDMRVTTVTLPDFMKRP